MTIELASKSDDNTTITFVNGRKFIVESKYTKIVKKWNVGIQLIIKSHSSEIPYSHEVTNPLTDESIFVGISSE